jgi:hypothetical protein
MSHRRLSEAQWRRLSTQFEQSGMTRKNFCKQEGVALSTFDLWLQKIRSTPTKPVPALGRFVELCLAPSVALEEAPAPSPRPAVGEGPELVVELPFGVVLRFRGMRP